MGNFVVMYCIQLLSFSLNGSLFNTIHEYPLINQAYSEKILKFSSESRIETVILIFVFLTHQTIKVDKTMDALRELFNNNLEKLSKLESPLIKIRFCNF